MQPNLHKNSALTGRAKNLVSQFICKYYRNSIQPWKSPGGYCFPQKIDQLKHKTPFKWLIFACKRKCLQFIFYPWAEYTPSPVIDIPITNELAQHYPDWPAYPVKLWSVTWPACAGTRHNSRHKRRMLGPYLN